MKPTIINCIRELVMSTLLTAVTISILVPISFINPALGADTSMRVIQPIMNNLDNWNLKGHKPRNKWEIGTARLSHDDPEKLIFSPSTTPTPELVNKTKGFTDIYTRETFGDCRVEVEVMIPEGSNSGIYLMGQYEVQVKDSYGKSFFLSAGDMGGIIGYSKPLENASFKAGQWQKFEIEFKAPRLKNKRVQTPAEFVKVILNGKVVQENVKMKKGPTSGALKKGEFETGPLMLQGGMGPVAYRNLKIYVPFK